MTSRLTSHPEIPTVLLTNDDGPCSQEESPFILGFSELLVSKFLNSQPEKLKVVIPDSQKSWIGKAYIIKDRLSVTNYDPWSASGGGPSSSSSQDCSEKKGCCPPWKLVSGTPASCSNLGLFNLYPNQIDLVISGPNYGRNTSSAFSLSSGTIGAAMDAALSNHRAIALSYGVFERPISQSIVQAAHEIAVKIIQHLWKNGFGDPEDEDYSDLYSVNIPLVPAILEDPKVVWTTESVTRYGRLFLPAWNSRPTEPSEIDVKSNELSEDANREKGSEGRQDPTTQQGDDQPLEFIFKPDISALIDPNATHHLQGSDAWALNRGYCTVTPLNAAFKSGPKPKWQSVQSSDGVQVWKL